MVHFYVFVYFVCFLLLVEFSCCYLCNPLPGKTRLRNDLLCVKWDVKPYNTIPYHTTYPIVFRLVYIVSQKRTPVINMTKLLSQRLLIIFGRERPYSVLSYYGKVF